MAKFQGLTEFQRDLLQIAQRETPKEVDRILKRAANKGARMAKVKAQTEVNKQSGLYLERFKGGKPFEGQNGERVVRVINSAPHACYKWACRNWTKSVNAKYN